MENIKYRVLSKPLRKTRYNTESPKERIVTADDIGEIYAKVEIPVIDFAESYTQDKQVENAEDAFIDILQEDAPAEEPEAPKRKLELFEEVEVDLTKEGIENAINSDGYYSEILPKDAGKNFKKPKRKLDFKKIILVIMLFIIGISGLVISIKNLI